MLCFQHMKPPRREIERKFLVLKDKLPKRLPKPKRIIQGYLLTMPVQVRLRMNDGRSELQIKGPGDFESTELPIPEAEASYLLKTHLEKGTGPIVKDRHVLPSAWKGLKWELDVFRARHRGLLLAEIEIPSKSFRLDPKKFPAWIGREVTGVDRYKNKDLARLRKG